MLDEKSPIALYHQLKTALLEKIKSQEWPLNSKIPTERELCEIYGVSRITVRQALRELERDGYLYRKQGKGTFVTTPQIEQRLSKFYSFSEEIRNMGHTPSTQILAFKRSTADDLLAGHLKISTNDPVFQITRLRLADQEPFAYETSFIPCEVCPRLTEEKVAAHGLYKAMALEGITPNKATETFEAVAISAEVAAFLKVKKNSPGLFLNRLTFAQEIPVEYCRTIIRGDRYKYRIFLQ